MALMFVVGCGHPKHREIGPELTAEEAGVYAAVKPQSVSAAVQGDKVEISWKHFGYAVDFVVLRRDISSLDSWQELHVHVNPFPDPKLLPLIYTDTAAARDSTYVYGVKTRNYNRQGVLIESPIVKGAPVTLR